MTTSSEIPVGIDLSALRCAAGTDVGMRRDENQDSFGVIRKPNIHAYFIADGMGGVHGGATASRLAISTLERTLPTRARDLSIPLLREIVQEINGSIYDAGAKDSSLAGMGTTLVGVVFTESASYCVNVGDSRLYRVRGDTILQLSEDHTLVRELVRSGAIKPEEAETHPVSHMLTRSLGPLERVEADCFALNELVKEGDTLVLCSDGLYNFVSDEEISGVVRQNSIDDANQILINLANQRGGADNITVLVVSIGQTTSGGRTEQFRKARDTSSPSSSEREHTVQIPYSAPSAAVSEIPPQVDAKRASLQVPTVEEPRKKGEKPRRSGLRTGQVLSSKPLSIPVIAALALVFVLGLAVGDGARQLGRTAVGWFRGDLPPAAAPATKESRATTTHPLERLSSDLQIQRPSTVEGGLPEIARQVQISPLEQAARQRRDKAGRERLGKAREFFEASVKKLEGQVALLSGTTAPSDDFVSRANREADDVQVTIDQVELQIDAASRKLSQWYGRQKRLEEQDPLKLASEVAASSPSVMGKKSELELATYELIKKRDEVELYPNDEKLIGELSQLKDRRGRLLRELQEAVRLTVEDVLLSVNEQLEDLKFQRDTANLQLQALKQDLEIAKVLGDAERNRREELKLLVIERLQGRQSALAVIQGAWGSDDPARVRQALLVIEGLSSQD